MLCQSFLLKLRALPLHECGTFYLRMPLLTGIWTGFQCLATMKSAVSFRVQVIECREALVSVGYGPRSGLAFFSFLFFGWGRGVVP